MLLWLQNHPEEKGNIDHIYEKFRTKMDKSTFYLWLRYAITGSEVHCLFLPQVAPNMRDCFKIMQADVLTRRIAACLNFISAFKMAGKMVEIFKKLILSTCPRLQKPPHPLPLLVAPSHYPSKI